MTEVLGTGAIELILDRSKFNRGIRDLEQEGLKPISVETKLDLRQINRQLAALKLPALEVEIRPNLRGFERQLRELGKTRVEVELQADIRGLERQLKGIKVAPLEVQLQADVKGLERQLKALQSQSGLDLAATLKIDETQAKRQIQSLQQQIGGDVLVNVRYVQKEPPRRQIDQEIRQNVRLETKNLEESVTKSVEEGFKKATPKVKGGGFLGLGNIVRGFQEGIGATYSTNLTSGVIKNLEKELNITLDQFGEKLGASFTRVGKFTGDRLVKRLGIEDGLAGLQAKIPEFRKFFDEIIDTKSVERKVSVLETQIGKLVDDLLTLKSVSQQVSNIKGIGGAIGDIAATPAEGLKQRRARIVKESAQAAQARAEQIEAPILPEGTQSVTLGIGGFAGVKGKSSGAVAERLQLLTGKKNPVVPLENTSTDLSVNVGEGKLKFLFQALSRLADQNVVKGANPDAIEAAAQAIAFQRANPNVPVKFAGYSAGGFVAQEAVEITKEAGLKTKGVGIGTPRFGLTGTTNSEEFQAILGEGDPLSKLTGLFGAKDAQILSDGGKAHKLSSYLGTGDTQQAILKQLGIKQQVAPELKSPVPFELVGFEQNLGSLAEDIGKVLSDQSQALFFKKTGLYQAQLQQIKTNRQKLAQLMEQAIGDVALQLQAYDEALVEAETIVKQVFGVQEAVAPAIQAKRADNQPVNEQATPPPEPPKPLPPLQTKALSSQELNQYTADQLQQLSRKSGGKGKGTKAELVEELLKSESRDVRQAIAALQASRQSQATVKPEQADNEQRLLATAKESEKRVNDTLREFQKAEGTRRESIAEAANNEINQTVVLLEKLIASESAETRQIAGRQRGRLEGLRKEFQAAPQPTPAPQPTATPQPAVDDSLLKSTYQNLAVRTTQVASLQQPEKIRLPALNSNADVFKGKNAAAFYESTQNQIYLPPDKLKRLQEVVGKKISELTQEQLDQAISELSTLAHETFHGVQFGFSKQNKTQLIESGGSRAIIPEASEAELQAFQKVKKAPVDVLAQKSVENAQATDSYKKLPEAQQQAVSQAALELEKGAYQFQAKVIAELVQQVEAATGQAGVTVAQVFDRAIDQVSKQLIQQRTALVQQAKAVTPPVPTVDTKAAQSDLNKFTVEILKEISRLTGRKATGKKADIVADLRKNVAPEDLETAIGAVGPSIETGPQGGQKLKKPEQSQRQKDGLAHLQKAQAQAEANLKKIDELEGEARQALIAKTQAFLDEQIGFADKYLTGKTFATETRFGAGKSKQSFEALRQQLARKSPVDVDSISLARVNPTQRAAKFLRSEDFAVNTAGFAGSIAGSAIAGPIGGLAGDLGGALVARKAFTDLKTLQAAREQLSGNPDYQSANPLNRLRQIYSASRAVQRANAAKQRENLIGDTSAFAIGNIASNALNLVPGLGNIPFKGAAFALSGSSAIVRATRREEPDANLARVGAGGSAGNDDRSGLGEKIRGFFSRFQKEQRLNADKTYQLVIQEAAKLSNITLKPGDIPKLVVDNARLGGAGARALYDIKRNQIIISKEVQQLLSGTIADIEKNQQAIADIVHESRHSFQFDFGRLSLKQIGKGVTPGVPLIDPENVPRDVKLNALRSVQSANQQAGGLLSKPVQRAIARTEVDAYAFEQIALPKVVGNVSAQLKQQQGTFRLPELKFPTIPIPENLRKLASIFNESRKGVDNLKKGFGELVKQIDSVIPGAGKLVGSLKGIVLGFVGFQVLNQVLPVLRQFVSESIQAAIRLDNLKTALNFASGGGVKGAQNLAFVRGEVDRLRVPLESAQAGFVKLAASTRGSRAEGATTQSLFTGVSSAATVLGLNKEESSGTLLAFSQIASKGKVYTEELLQLQERIPGFITTVQRALGLTGAQLSKALEQGSVSADEFLPKIARQLQIEFGGSAVEASKNAQSAIFNLQNSFQKLQESTGSAFGPALIAGANALSAVLDGIGKKAAEVSEQFNKIAAVIGIVLQPIAALGQKIGAIPGVGKAIEVALNGALAIVAVLGGSIAFNLIAKLLTLPAIAKIVAAGLSAIGGAIASAVAALPALLGKFLLLQLAVEAVTGALSVFVPSDLGQQFSGFADQAEANLNRIGEAADRAKGKVKDVAPPPGELPSEGPDIGKALTLGTFSLKTDDIINFLNTPVNPAAEKAAKEGTLPKIRKISDVKYENDVLQADRFGIATQELTGKVTDGSIPQALQQTATLDKQIQEVQNKRTLAASKPQADKNELAALDGQLQSLQAQKEKVAAPVTELKGALQTQLDNAKKAIDSINAKNLPKENADALKAPFESSKAQLEQAIASINKFEGSIKSSVGVARELTATFTELATKLEEAKRSADRLFNQQTTGALKQQVAKFGTDALAGQRSSVQQAQAEQTRLQSQFTSGQSILDQQKTALSGSDAQSLLAGIPIGTTGKSVTIDSSIAEIDTALKGLSDKDTDKKNILERLKEFRQGQDQQGQLGVQLEQSNVKVQESKQTLATAELDRNAAIADSSNQNKTNSQIATVRNRQVAKGLSDTQVGADLALINLNSTKATEKNLKTQLGALENAYKQGLISASEYENRKRQLEGQLGDVGVKKAEQELALRKAISAKILENIQIATEKAELQAKKVQNAQLVTIKLRAISQGLDANDSDIAVDTAKVDLAATGRQEGIAARELAALRANKSRIDPEEFRKKSQELEGKLSDLTVQKAEKELALRDAINRKIIEGLELANQQATAAIQRSETERVTANKATLATTDPDVGKFSEAQVERSNTLVEADSTSQRIAQKQREVEQNRKLVADKNRSAKEGLKIELQLQQELAELNQKRVEQEIRLQKELRDKRIQLLEEVEKFEIKSLERTKSLLQAQQGLSKALNDMYSASDKGRADQLGRAVELVKKRDDENAGPETQEAARRQLTRLGLDEGATEIDVLTKKAEIENQIAARKMAAQEMEFDYQRRILELEIQRDKLAAKQELRKAKRDVRDAEKAERSAKSDYQKALQSGDPEQIKLAREALESAGLDVQGANEGLKDAQASADSVDQMAEYKRQTLTANQNTQRQDTYFQEENRAAAQDMNLAEVRDRTGEDGRSREVADQGFRQVDGYGRQLSGIYNQQNQNEFANLNFNSNGNSQFAYAPASPTAGDFDKAGGGGQPAALTTALNEGFTYLGQKFDELSAKIEAAVSRPTSLSFNSQKPADDYADYQNRQSGNALRSWS